MNELIKVIDKGLGNDIKINKLNHKSINSSIHISGNNNVVYIESRVNVKDLKILIKGDNNTILIKRGSIFKGGNISIGNNAKLEIGERANVGSGAVFFIDRASAIWGNDIVAAEGLIMKTTESYGIYDISTETLLKSQDIIVGDYVCLEQNVTLKKGCVVSAGTMITERSVLLDRTKHFELWSGVPAKKTQENIIWSKSLNLKSINDDKTAKFYLDKYSDYIIKK
ncbi:hypothetical protein SAMN05660772_01417 [Pasteurella testudinis DSM 23072]|uniref:Acetyltransferase (Isoleucine patch superfamily) n=1 Tax=Pasteurella testudinis DSM 23072 TaxID=1122938 RepID=A0A1W1V8X8_9PAST|nr:hypothetical protein [Pasteurella testudinis]SMB89822.1 hypothetical protein SAMN05660772_01417 [Pasteurella testudinis DSM 23072]SUB52099.1 Acetyltransferase (isoleucine patch superfamily) [Pasteurella testudinis]